MTQEEEEEWAQPQRLLGPMHADVCWDENSLPQVGAVEARFVWRTCPQLSVAALYFDHAERESAEADLPEAGSLQPKLAESALTVAELTESVRAESEFPESEVAVAEVAEVSMAEGGPVLGDSGVAKAGWLTAAG